MKNVFEMSLEELQRLPYTVCWDDIRPFNGIVIVPTGCEHDSGYGLMKFVLVDRFKVVGVIGGDADLAYLDGKNYRIDILPKSNCTRVFIYDGYIELTSSVMYDNPVFNVRLS